MKSIECENNLQNYDQLNNKKLKFQDIIFGFQYDGMLYQTSTNTSYSQLKFDEYCEPGQFKLDTRCRYWYNNTVNDPFLKIFPPSEFYSDATTPFLASVFCKRNLINKEIYSVLCYSIKLFQIYDFFEDFNKYSSTQITIDPDTLSLVYHSDLQIQRDQNKNDFSDNFSQMEQLLNEQQLKSLNKVRNEISNRFTSIQSERKDSISLTELFDDVKYQKTFEFNFDGQNYFAIINIIKTIDKSKLFPVSRKSDLYTVEQQQKQDGSIGYKIKNTYYFIDILSKELLTKQQSDLYQEVIMKQKPLNIVGYFFLFISFLMSIYQSFVLGRLIDAPIMHLTAILEKMRLNDKSLGNNFNLFEVDQVFSVTREKSQSENDSEGDSLNSQQKKLNKKQHYFLSEDMKILFTSFQTLFQTLNFTMQSYFENKDDEGCQTLLNLNIQAEHFKKFSNFRALGVCYNNMGNIHVNNQRYKEAFQCYQKAVISSRYELSYYEEKVDKNDIINKKDEKKHNQDLTIIIQSNKLHTSSQNGSIDKGLPQNRSSFKKIANIFTDLKQNYLRRKNSSKFSEDQVKGAKQKLKPYLLQNLEGQEINRTPELLGTQQLDQNEKEFQGSKKINNKETKNNVNDQFISYQQINSKEFTQQNIPKEQKDDGTQELYWILFHRKFNQVKALLTHFLFFAKGERLYDGMDFYFEELLEINKNHLNNEKYCTFIVNFYYISLLVKVGEIQKSRQKQEENIAIYFQITQGYLENLPINTQLQVQKQQMYYQQQLNQQLQQQQNQLKQKQQKQYSTSTKNSNEMLQSKLLKKRVVRSQNKKNTLQVYIDQFNTENSSKKKEKSNFTTSCLPNPHSFHSLDSLEASPPKVSQSHQIFKEFLKKNPSKQLKYLEDYQDVFYILDQYYTLIRDMNNSFSLQANFPYSASDLDTKKITNLYQKHNKSSFSNEPIKQVSLNPLDTTKQSNQLFKEIYKQNSEIQQDLSTQRKNNKEDLQYKYQRNSESSKQLNQQQTNQIQYQLSQITPQERFSFQKQNSIFSSYRPSFQQNERLSTFNQTNSNQVITQRTFTNQFVDQKKQSNSISRLTINRCQQQSIGNSVSNQCKIPQYESQNSQKTFFDENITLQNKTNNHIIPQTNLFKKSKISQFHMDVDLDQIARYEYTPDLLCGFLIYAETVILCAENRILESAYIMTDYFEQLKYFSRQLKYQIVSRFLFVTQMGIPKLLSPLLQLKNIYDYDISFSLGVISTSEVPKFLNKSRQFLNLILNSILTRSEDQFGLICFSKSQIDEVIPLTQMSQIKGTPLLIEDILNLYVPQSSILLNSSFFYEKNTQDKQHQRMSKQSFRSDQILENQENTSETTDNKSNLFESVNKKLQQQMYIQDKFSELLQKQKIEQLQQQQQYQIQQQQSNDKQQINPHQQQLVTFEGDFMQKSQISLNEFQNPNIKSFVQGSNLYSFTKLKSKCDILNSMPSINDIDQPLKSYDEKEIDIHSKLNKYCRQIEARNKQKTENDKQFIQDFFTTDQYQDVLLHTQDQQTHLNGCIKESNNKSSDDIEVLNSSNRIKTKVVIHPDSSQIYNQGTQINLPLELISGNEQSNINLIDNDLDNDVTSNQYYQNKRNISMYSEINNSVQTPISHKNQSNIYLLSQQNSSEKKNFNKQQNYLNISFKQSVNDQENQLLNKSVLEKQNSKYSNTLNVIKQNNIEQSLNHYEQMQNNQIELKKPHLELNLNIHNQKQNKKEQIIEKQEQNSLNKQSQINQQLSNQSENKNQRFFNDNYNFNPNQYGQFNSLSPNKKLSLISSIDEDTSKILSSEQKIPFVIKQEIINNSYLNENQKRLSLSDDQKFHFTIKKAITSFFCKNNFMNHYLLSEYKKSNKFTDIHQDKLDNTRQIRKKYLVYITEDKQINQENNLYKKLSQELYNIDLELLILSLNQNESTQEYSKYQNIVIKNKTVIRYFQNEVRLAEYIFNERESKKYKQFPLMYEHYSNDFLLVNLD